MHYVFFHSFSDNVWKYDTILKKIGLATTHKDKMKKKNNDCIRFRE